MNDHEWFKQCDRNHVYKKDRGEEFDEGEFRLIDFNQADDYILIANSKFQGGYLVDIDRLKAVVSAYIEQQLKNLYEETKVVIKLPVSPTPVLVAIIIASITKFLPENPIFGSRFLDGEAGKSLLYRIQ